MSNLTEAAHTLTGYGLSVVPCKDDKRPVVYWDAIATNPLTVEEINALMDGHTIRPDYVSRDGHQGVRMFAPCTAIGVVCGAVSGGVEVLDVDCKYDDTGTLYADLMQDIERIMPEVYKRLVIVSTQSGGYHIPYRAPNVQGNLPKIARRPVSNAERERYAAKQVKAGKTEEEAQRLAQEYKELVLMETRGERGYVLVPPSEGYYFVRGDYSKLPELTAQERDDLLNIARAYNRIHEEPVQAKAKPTAYASAGAGGALSPFEDYNRRGDVLELLHTHGWSIVYQAGERVLLRRPGGESKTSGNYHQGLRCLTVFSSNTIFEAGKAYAPASVFITLECNGDPKEAARRLRAMGYGDKPGGGVPLAHVQVDAVNTDDNTTRVIGKPGAVLSEADIKSAGKDNVVITSPGAYAMDEVVQVVDKLLHQGTRVYVMEEGVEEAGYLYKLHHIHRRYDALADTNGGVLSERDVHAFLDEVVYVSHLLEPMHRDLYKNAFLSHPAVILLGIKQEAMDAAEERLQYRAQADELTQSLRGINSKVEELLSKGRVEDAVRVFKEAQPDLTARAKVEEFKERMRPQTLTGLLTDNSKRAPAFPSGYVLSGEMIEIPSAALSFYAACSGHGKTSMLINTMLHAVELEECAGREFHFITYEMDARSIVLNILNVYLGCDVAYDNYKALDVYFTNGDTSLFNPDKVDYVLARAERFDKELIQSGRIRVHHVDDTSGTLAEFITHLHRDHNNIGGVFIDYVQLISPDTTSAKQARFEVVKDVCDDLRRVAINTGLPLVIAAQFTRGVQSHYDLDMRMISEGSDIEKSAALILAAWNNDKKPHHELLTKASKDEIYRAKTFYIKSVKRRYGRDEVWALIDWHGNSRRIGGTSGTVVPEPKKFGKARGGVEAIG